MCEVNIAALGISYRRMGLSFGAQLILCLAGSLLGTTLGRAGVAEVVDTVFYIGILGTSLALAYFGYKTAAALGSRVSIVWALAVLVPYVDVIGLLVLSARATWACRERGVAVGLFGPRVGGQKVGVGSQGAA